MTPSLLAIASSQDIVDSLQIEDGGAVAAATTTRGMVSASVTPTGREWECGGVIASSDGDGDDCCVLQVSVPVGKATKKLTRDRSARFCRIHLTGHFCGLQHLLADFMCLSDPFEVNRLILCKHIRPFSS